MSSKRPEPDRPPAGAAEYRDNAILHGLADEDAARLLHGASIVTLTPRQTIYEPEQPIVDVFFPLEAIISIVAEMRDGTAIEVGTIGREGVSAIPLLMGAAATANASYCQVPGRAVRVPARVFREVLASTPPFRQLLDRYLQAYVNMLGQLAACNRLHSVDERCARWLLLSLDRVGGNVLALTHEFLAMMLGTTRSGVSIAAATFARAGFIEYAHGKITVLDRAGLESASCECYAVARDQFGGLLRTVNGGRPEPGPTPRPGRARSS